MKSDVLKGFGAEVRRRRHALKLSAAQLGDRAGLQGAYIGQIERGIRDLSISSVLKLAKGLGVHPGDLLGGFADLSPAALEFSRFFGAIKRSETRAAVLDLLRRIVKFGGRR